MFPPYFTPPHYHHIIAPFHCHHNTTSHLSVVITIQHHTFSLSSQYNITPFYCHHNTTSHLFIVITIQHHTFPLSSQYNIIPFYLLLYRPNGHRYIKKESSTLLSKISNIIGSDENLYHTLVYVGNIQPGYLRIDNWWFLI